MGSLNDFSTDKRFALNEVNNTPRQVITSTTYASPSIQTITEIPDTDGEMSLYNIRPNIPLIPDVVTLKPNGTFEEANHRV